MTDIRTEHAQQVREVVLEWLPPELSGVGLGLPEFDDRFALWRVSLVSAANGHEGIGEVRVKGNSVVFSTNLDLVARRMKKTSQSTRPRRRSKFISFAPVPSRIVLGDAREVLAEHPPDSVQLVFTSPPYYNARPEYHETVGYKEYLDLLREVFQRCHDVLSEGRFLVVNTSPVLMRRPHRGASSKRIPITYDLHPIINDIGFDFIDDIVWRKPEGAGWNIGRGRRFAADRQPLQYKAVSVTENVVVYRKKTDRLIDWNIHKHPNPDAVKSSLIEDGYERTNVWDLHPAHHQKHPAVFPEALAERVTRYYSFKGDMVLDPFAGSGTTGRVAGRLERRFLMIDNNPDYFAVQKEDPELRWHGPQVMEFDYYATTL